MAIKPADIEKLRADLEALTDQLAARMRATPAGDEHAALLRDLAAAIDRAAIYLIKQPDYQPPPKPITASPSGDKPKQS